MCIQCSFSFDMGWGEVECGRTWLYLGFADLIVSVSGGDLVIFFPRLGYFLHSTRRAFFDSGKVAGSLWSRWKFSMSVCFGCCILAS